MVVAVKAQRWKSTTAESERNTNKDPDIKKKARCRKMFEQLPSEIRRLEGGSKGWGYIDGPIYH